MPQKSGHALGDPGDGPCVFFAGAEVVGGGEACRVWRSGEEFFGEAHVAVQRFEDMLPGTNGMGTADAHGLAGEEAANEIGDETVAWTSRLRR